MIELNKLGHSDIGRWVIYSDRLGYKEEGRIKSWNHFVVFVVYKCDNQWGRFLDYTGQATCPEDLRFETLLEHEGRQALRQNPLNPSAQL